MNTIESVREFNAALGAPVVDKPTLLEAQQLARLCSGTGALSEALDAFRNGARRGCRASLRLALETEELLELAEALRDGDLEGALDAQVDRRYVADGTTLELGLASVFDEAFRRVHVANMAKLGPDGQPIIDAAGKVRKPEGWQAPNLADLVMP